MRYAQDSQKISEEVFSSWSLFLRCQSLTSSLAARKVASAVAVSIPHHRIFAHPPNRAPSPHQLHTLHPATMFTSPTHIYIVNRETTTGPGSGDVHHTNLGLFWTIAEANACARAQIPGLSPSDGDEDNRRLWPEWYTKDEDGGICIKNIR